MNISWSEMLPLPKSQPGWAVAFILFFFSVTPFIIFHDSLQDWHYYQTHFSYSNIVNSGQYKLDVQVFAPKYVLVGDNYVIRIHIKNLGAGEAVVNEIILTQMSKADDVPGFTYDTFPMDEVIVPFGKLEKNLPVQVPEATQNKSELGLNMQILDTRLVFPMNFTEDYLFGTVLIDNNETNANSIVEWMLSVKIGISILLCIAMISAGAMERKDHKKLLLSDAAGMKTIRIIFVRSLPVYVSLALLIILVVVFSNKARIVLAVLVFVGLLYWLFKPNVEELFQIIRRKVNKEKHLGKP